MFKKITYIFFTSLLVLEFISCNNIYSETQTENINTNNVESQTDNVEKSDSKKEISLEIKVEQKNTSRMIRPCDVTENQFTKIELKAKKTSEEEYTSIWTWNSFEELTSSPKVSLEYSGYHEKYRFELNLYVTKNGKFLLCQHQIKEQYVSYEDNKIVFWPYYVDVSDESILCTANVTVNWDKSAEVASIKAGLFTRASSGKTPVENFEMETLEISETENIASASYSKNNIPSGIYFIRFELYSKNGILINTLEDIITMVNYTDTIKSLTLSKVNKQFTITYNSDKDNFKADFVAVTSRNANKSEILPTDKDFTHNYSGYFFNGWYKEADFSGEPVLEIQAGTAENLVLYAKWEEITAANILELIVNNVDDRVFTVKEGEVLSEDLIKEIHNTYSSTYKHYKIGLDFSKTEISSIGNFAFSDFSELTSILLPDTIATIGDNAFSGCNGLENITIPDSVTTLGDYAFSGCSGLKNITIPDSVTSLGDYVFSSARNLSEIILPENLSSLGNYCFNYCSSLTSINLPSKLENIGNNAFYKCTSLTEVTLPANIKTIGNSIFSDCSELQTANINCNIPDSTSSPFKNCIKLQTVKFDNNVTSIGAYAFNECKAIKNITLPEKLSNIGTYSFANCEGLEKITFNNLITTIEKSAFANCTSLTAINLPESVTTLKEYSFNNCSGLTEITLPESITSLQSNAFYNCKELKKVNLNCNLSTNTSPFTSCSKLETIVIGNNVSSIVTSAITSPTLVLPETIPTISGTSSLKNNTIIYTGTFKQWLENAKAANNSSYITKKVTSVYDLYIGEEKLVDLTLPDDITELPANAFVGCGSLKTVNLPATLKTIGQNVFMNCINLETANINCDIPGSVNIFLNCSKLTTVNLANTVTSLGSYAFKSCGITEITLPESLKSIDKYAFSGCTSLVSVNINCNLPDYTQSNNSPFYNLQIQDLNFGSNVASIGKYAFNNNSSVQTINFTDKIPTFKDYNTFSRVSEVKFNGSLLQYINNVGNFTKNLSSAYDLYINNLKISNLVIPEELTTLPYNVFNGCASITDITWNEKLTSIKYGAFYECQNLSNLNLPEGLTSIEELCFAKCSNLTEVTLPETLTSIGYQAFSECTKLTQITLPESMTTLGNKCFEKCEGLETITINCNLTDYANSISSPFYNCSNIKNIIFGSNVTSIGEYNFYGLTSLKSFIFNESIPIFNYYNTRSVDEVHFNGTLKDWMTNAKNIVKNFNSYNLYLNEEKFTYLNITDEDITEIPDYAFYKCKSLEQFFIRTDKLETIGNYAFYGCTELYNGGLVEGIKTIGDYAFSGCTNYNKNSRMNIPSTVVNFGKHVFDGCINLNNITVKCKLPEATNKNDSAFYGAVLTQIAFEYDIPAYALYDQNSLEYVSMTSNVTKIGDYAFYNCQNLKLLKPDPEFFLPIGLENIGDYAFKQCYALTAITLPRTITSIGKCAFESCTNLVTVNLKCDMPSFAKNTEAPFTGCTKFEILNIINKDDFKVKSIGNYAFYKSNIKEINFPSSVKKFGVSSFALCEYLKTITLNSVPQQISSNAFQEVTGELKFGSDETLNFFNKATYYKDPDKTKTCNLQGEYYLNYNTWKIEETLDKSENRNETLIRLN